MNNYGRRFPSDHPLHEYFPGLSEQDVSERCGWWEYGSTVQNDDRGADQVAKAQLQWERVVKLEIPGLAVTPLPMRFLLNRRMLSAPWAKEFGDWTPGGYVPLEQTFEENLDGVEIWVNDVFESSREWDSWKYRRVAEKSAPGLRTSPFDLPNPRVYWLDGTLAYVPENDHIPVGPWLKTLFLRGIVHVWGVRECRSTRQPLIWSYLNHHYQGGGNQSAFSNFIDDLLTSSMSSMDIGLSSLLRVWLEEKRSGTDSLVLRGHEAPLTEITSNHVETVLLPAQRFVDIFGETRWRVVQDMMTELDIRVVKRKGKGRLIASIHAAFIKWNLPLPRPKDTPPLFNATFPGIEAAEGKVKFDSPMNEHRKDTYAADYRAARDWLSTRS